MENLLFVPDYGFIRMLFERSLALIFFVAFLSAFNQFPALLGEDGLLPVPRFLKLTRFKQFPSLFHWRYSDRLFRIVATLGMTISLFIGLGFYAEAPVWLHLVSWLTLYGLYLSIVSVGQDFYGFGWETMLLEMGYFAAFMGPQWVTPSWIPILILRWMLFRTEMGAGLIKLRGDPCWRDLTCLYYHHETQPLPNPLSRCFHHQPKWFHRFGVVFSHFVQLVMPIGLFLPQPIASVAGAFIILHQLILIISGNYSWLNWITIVLGLLAFTDPIPAYTFVSPPMWFQVLQWGVGIQAIFLSYHPFLNLFAKNQRMNSCWNRWHLVGAYGAFGSVTKKRYEIVIEGTTDPKGVDSSIWYEYEFKGKPVKLDKLPPVVAPYHLRLDWMLWFLPFTVLVSGKQIYVTGQEVWFIRFVMKLLDNDKEVLKLLKRNPFKDNPPLFIRAKFYHYEFTTDQEFKESGNVWKREYLDEFLPAISLKSLERLS